MIRFAHILLFCCCSAGLWSCAVDSPHSAVDKVDLSFEVIVSTQSRSLQAPLTAYPSDVPFGFWLMSLPEKQSWSEHSSEAKLISANSPALFSAQSKTWLPSPPVCWINDGTAASIVAYSPFREDAIFTPQTGICVSDFEIGKTEELLYTAPITDKSLLTSSGRVLLNFQRALASVGFSVVSGIDDDRIITVKRISLTPVLTSGSFQSLPYPKWTPDKSSACELVIFEGEQRISGVQTVGERVNVLPQSPSVQINLVCDVLFGSLELKDQLFTGEASLNWEPGKIHEYRLTLRGNYNVELKII